jgi:hypothetical protein
MDAAGPPQQLGPVVWPYVRRQDTIEFNAPHDWPQPERPVSARTRSYGSGLGTSYPSSRQCWTSTLVSHPKSTPCKDQVQTALLTYRSALPRLIATAHRLHQRHCVDLPGIAVACRPPVSMLYGIAVDVRVENLGLRLTIVGTRMPRQPTERTTAARWYAR